MGVTYFMNCPQCHSEQDYFRYMGIKSTKEKSEFFDSGENRCGICNDRGSINMTRYLIIMGNPRRALELEYKAKR